MKLLYLCSRTEQIRNCVIDNESASVSPSGKTSTNKEGVKVGMSPVTLPWNGKCWYKFVIFNRYTNGQRNRDVHLMHGLRFSSSVRESTQKQRPSRAMKSSVQVLVSECRSPTRSRASSVEAGARWAWNSSWRHKVRKWSQQKGAHQKGAGTQTGVPSSLSWDNLSDKIIILLYNPWNKINIHGP